MVSELEFDSESLIRALNEGKGISDEEIESVVGLLEIVQKKRPRPEVEERLKIYRTPGLDEIYSLLTILSKAEATEQSEVIDSFLNYQDPLTVTLVLETLCIKWKLTGRYLERIVEYALGVPWDYDEDVKFLALEIIARHVAQAGGIETSSRELLELISTSFNFPDPWTKLKAYQAILLATGEPEEKIPSDYSSLDFSKNSPDIDWAVVTKFEKRVRAA